MDIKLVKHIGYFSETTCPVLFGNPYDFADTFTANQLRDAYEFIGLNA
jgi:hypothetical protein